MSKANDRVVAVLIASVIGGGGIGVVLPKVAPNWYRPDPATGKEIDSLQRDVEMLRDDFQDFLKDGPRRVTENQARIEAKLDTVLIEIRRRGDEHRRNGLKGH